MSPTASTTAPATSNLSISSPQHFLCPHNYLECCSLHCCHHNHCPPRCSHLQHQIMPPFLYCILPNIRNINPQRRIRKIFNWTSNWLTMMVPLQIQTQQTPTEMMKMTTTLFLHCYWLRIFSHSQQRLIHQLLMLPIFSHHQDSYEWFIIWIVVFLHRKISSWNLIFLKYQHILAEFQLVGKIIARPNKRTSKTEKKLMQFNGTIMQQTLASVKMT